jgi:2'-5' RNA ligase
VIDLHTDIVHSLKGLIKEEDGERYELERFTPHVTIGECIPSEVFPHVKQRFSESKLYCEVKITSFALFSADEKGMWKTAHVFKLSE